MEPFRDPVVTPDGNSFERTALMDHLQKARSASIGDVGMTLPASARPS